LTKHETALHLAKDVVDPHVLAAAAVVLELRVVFVQPVAEPLVVLVEQCVAVPQDVAAAAAVELLVVVVAAGRLEIKQLQLMLKLPQHRKDLTNDLPQSRHDLTSHTKATAI